MAETKQIPKFNTKLFREIFETAEGFISDYKESGLANYTLNGVTKQYVSDENLRVLYHLIFSRHANDPIRNLDQGQFKYKVFAIIFQYGPTWQKRLELQNEARSLTTEQASVGTFSVFNHAYNDASDVQSAGAINGELQFVNDQNVSKYKKGKTETILSLWEILKADITETFLEKFDPLFKIVGDTNPELYITYYEED